MRRVVGIGAGGHARVVIEILRLAVGFEVVALVDIDRDLWGREVDGVPIVGDDPQLPEMLRKGVGYAFNGVGGTSGQRSRRRIFERATGLGFEFVEAIHPNAVVSISSSLGAGATVMANATVNAGSEIGANVIVNTGAIVEHDCTVGDHSHIASGSRLGGGVRVGEGSHIGIGASVREGISIGDNSIVGAGAVVVRDVPDDVVVVGVPAKVLRMSDT